MTPPKALQTSFILGVIALALALGADAHAQNTCNAGKVKCMAKKQLCLLKAEGVALKRGEPVDAAKLQKCIDAFEDDEKGCIAKLEGRQKAEKPKTLCTETGDVAALEASVDAYVDDLLQAIVLDYPAVEPRNLCHPKLALCVGKYAQCVLTALQKGFKKGDPVDSDALQKCSDKFSNAETGKGCMEKVYAKQNPEKPESLCDVPDDVANLNVKTAAFVTDVIRLVLQTCEDGIQNLDETDVDCGGSCAACANGNSCLAHTDCAEFFCNGDTCQENLCLTPCAPPNQCQAGPGVCIDPVTGTCQYPARADGTPCDDGTPNTSSDVCSSGICMGTPCPCLSLWDDNSGSIPPISSVELQSCWIGPYPNTVAAESSDRYLYEVKGGGLNGNACCGESLGPSPVACAGPGAPGNFAWTLETFNTCAATLQSFGCNAP